jgi:hypothetical protein
MAEDKQDSEATETQAEDPPRDAAGKQGALERFKNSHLGQILMTAVAVATLTAGVAHWFYESIRIPAMTSQIAFRDDKIKSLETELQTDREKTKALGVDLERERFQSSGLKGALDQSTTKLKQLQDGQMSLVQELNSLKLKQVQSGGISRTNEADNHDRVGLAIDVEQAVNLAADQEDAAFLSVSHDLTELRLCAYAIFSSSASHAQSTALAKVATRTAVDMPTFIQEIGGCLTSMLEFRNTLEEMQAFTTKVILMHYRAELAEFDPSKASGFLSQVRLKPQIVTKLSDLTKKLKSNSNSPTWQTDATKAVAEFMNSSGNATNGQSGSAAPKTPPSR